MGRKTSEPEKFCCLTGLKKEGVRLLNWPVESLWLLASVNSDLRLPSKPKSTVTSPLPVFISHPTEWRRSEFTWMAGCIPKPAYTDVSHISINRSRHKMTQFMQPLPLPVTTRSDCHPTLFYYCISSVLLLSILCLTLFTLVTHNAAM